jgi:TonB family protein
MTTSKRLPNSVSGSDFGNTQAAVISAQLAAQAEDQNGERAVEVSAVFDSTVQEVRHFSNPRAGRISNLTKGVLTFSALSLGSVMALFGTSYAQISAEKAAAESQQKSKSANERSRERARDVAAGSLLMLGAAGLAYGLTRLGREQGESEYTLGTDPKASYQVSTEGLPCARFPLIRSNGSSFELLVAESMKGKVTRDGKQMELQEFAQAAKSDRDAALHGAAVLPIPEGVRFAIEQGGSTFLVQSVAKPRHYPVPLRVDWGTQSYTGAVMAGAAAFVGLMFVLPPDAKSLSLDGFDTGRLVKLNAKAQEVEEQPDWLKPKQKEPLPKERTAPSSSQRSYRTPTPQRNQPVVAMKPGPMTKKEKEDQARTIAGQTGVLAWIKTAGPASIFGGGSAIGDDAKNAIDGLIADDASDSYGNGGPMVATGPIGGGGGDTINSNGLPFGPGGPGGHGRGPRGPALGPYRAKAPTTELGRVEVNAGNMDREVIRRVIRSHMPEVKFCYERALMGNKDLQGRVQVKFMIGATGKVAASVVELSTLHNQTTEQCVAEAVRRWEFPKPPAGIVSVTYPFVFKPAGE